MSLVLYSGGCDSTLVLHDLLKENNRGGSHVGITSLSINHIQVPANTQNKAARLSFIEEIKKRELDSNFHYQEVDIGGNACVSHIGDLGLSQPIIWSMIAMLYVQDNETIYFGYHSGDDFWLHKNEFEDAIKSICKICNKTIKIEYPLRHHYKSDIIRSLKNRGLYDLCWYCEYPQPAKSGAVRMYDPCGNCTPCRTHRTALWQIEAFGDKSPTSGGSANYDIHLSMPVVAEAIKDAGIVPCCSDETIANKEVVMLKGT